MIKYTVILTEAENEALSYVALDQQQWIDNAVHERCRVATEEIVQLVVQKCLENNIQIPPSKDEMVSLAFDNGWVKSVEQKNQEFIG